MTKDTMPAAAETPRYCQYCGKPLAGLRKHARYCNPVCRANGSRHKGKTVEHVQAFAQHIRDDIATLLHWQRIHPELSAAIMAELTTIHNAASVE